MNSFNPFSKRMAYYGTYPKSEQNIPNDDFLYDEVSRLAINDAHEETKQQIPKFLTSNSIEELKKFIPSKYEPTNVLLLKGVPYDCSEIDFINLTRQFGDILDIYLVRHKQYVYIHFKVFIDIYFFIFIYQIGIQFSLKMLSII